MVVADEGNHCVFYSLSCNLVFHSISGYSGRRSSDRISAVCDLWNAFSVYDDLGAFRHFACSLGAA